MSNRFSDENRRIKGRVVRKGKHGHENLYTDQRGGKLEKDKAEYLGGFENVANPNRKIGKKHSANYNENPFEWMEYTGDRIGLIHIAALIPHFGRKKKRK